jgi:hypothetical protein
MRLARIEHWRCGEPISWRGGGGYTYVWVPDEMAAQELDALCEQARKSYLDAEQEFKKLTPVFPPGYGAAILPSTPDTKTVGELRAEHEAATKAYKEHQAMADKSRRPFAWHLSEVSGGTVIQFREHEPDLEVELSWGHSHGVTIDHSPTAVGDFPFAEDGDDDF